MIFPEVLQIAYRSAAVIHSGAAHKFDLCRPYLMDAIRATKRAKTDVDIINAGFRRDRWQELMTGYQWELRFYSLTGLEEGKGIRDLFERAFDIVKISPEHDWDSIFRQEILRPISFSEAPDFEIPDYEYEEFNQPDWESALTALHNLLLEEALRGVSLAYWTDSQIEDKDQYDPKAVALWDQIIDQAKKFYDMNCYCGDVAAHQAVLERDRMVVDGGVFAVNLNLLNGSQLEKVEYL